MNKDYPFWKLLRAQWSWKNDRVMLGINLISGFFISCVNFLFTEVTYTGTGLPVEGFDLAALVGISTIVIASLMILFYQSMKAILFTVVCFLVCYYLREEFSNHERYSELECMYNEALLWRQV